MRYLFLILLVLFSLSACSYHDPTTPYPTHGEIKRYGLFAHLESEATTDIPLADTPYLIQGNFSNFPNKGFYVNESLPGIVYNNTHTQYFKIIFDSTLSDDTNGATVTVIVYKNGVPVNRSEISNYFKFAFEVGQLSGNSVVEIEPGDYIQLYVKADKPGTSVTFIDFTTSINTFFGA